MWESVLNVRTASTHIRHYVLNTCCHNVFYLSSSLKFDGDCTFTIGCLLTGLLKDQTFINENDLFEIRIWMLNNQNDLNISDACLMSYLNALCPYQDIVYFIAAGKPSHPGSYGSLFLLCSQSIRVNDTNTFLPSSAKGKLEQHLNQLENHEGINGISNIHH